jgi:hypothetical protein
MSEVTYILSAIEQGDPHAVQQLLPLVYAGISAACGSAESAVSAALTAGLMMKTCDWTDWEGVCNNEAATREACEM